MVLEDSNKYVEQYSEATSVNCTKYAFEHLVISTVLDALSWVISIHIHFYVPIARKSWMFQLACRSVSYLLLPPLVVLSVAIVVHVCTLEFVDQWQLHGLV